MTNLRIVSVLAVTTVLATSPRLDAQQRIERRFAVAPTVAVRIYNLVGVTRVTGWDRDTIAVVADIPEGGGKFFGGGHGDVAKVGIERQDETLKSKGATFEIHVPRRARVWIKSASARVEVGGLAGDLEVSSVTGLVRAEISDATVRVESIEGDVEIRGSSPVVRVHTGAGPVTLVGPQSDVVVSTVGGRVTITEAQMIQGAIETISGPVGVSGMVGAGGLQVRTHDADVDLVFTPSIAADLDLQSVTGQVVTTLVPKGRPVAERGLIKRRLGAGGPRVMVRSLNGQIRVSVSPR
ncbi:MAG: hypothetical protein ABI647_13405 [Gemmatimonadota bacterium]